MIGILFGVFFLLILLGVPISFAIGLSTIATIVFSIDTLSASIFLQRMFAGINSFPLMCIAFFILSGDLMSNGNLTKNIVKFANAFVGRIPGGLAHVNVLGSMMFGGVSGSANADVSSLGPLEIAMMRDAGYHKEFSVAVTVASATIGIIIPPSIPMVIYASSAGGVSISDMFMAGIIPGILIGIAMMITCYIISKKRNYPKEPKHTFSENLKAVCEGLPTCFLFVIIMGGILAGIFTPTEASVIAALYSFILSVLCYRTVKLNQVPKIMINSALSTAVVLFLIGVSTAFSFILAYAKVPQMVTEFILSVTQVPSIVFILMYIVFLIVGTFMDTSPALIILTPIFLPLAESCGMDPVQFGLFMIVALSIGLYTPPVGAVLFIGAKIGDVSIEQASLACMPFWISVTVVVMCVIFIPELTLWLPSVFG